MLYEVITARDSVRLDLQGGRDPGGPLLPRRGLHGPLRGGEDGTGGVAPGGTAEVVITSYSIHYTKLYDFRCRMCLVRRSRFRSRFLYQSFLAQVPMDTARRERFPDLLHRNGKRLPCGRDLGT